MKTLIIVELIFYVQKAARGVGSRSEGKEAKCNREHAVTVPQVSIDR